jgi:hypothetical protein
MPPISSRLCQPNAGISLAEKPAAGHAQVEAAEHAGHQQ